MGSLAYARDDRVTGSRRRSVIRDRRRFVTAAQNRVVQIGRVSFSSIKRYDDSFASGIYPDVANPRDAHERFAQFADAFIAILAFRCDRDSLQHWFVCAVQVMRVGWIEMLRIEWFDHPSIYASGRAAPVGSAGVWYVRGARAASPQLPAACRQHSMHPRETVQTESRQAAETCRLAACAPQNGREHALPSRRDGNDRNIGLWPVRPAGWQPAASPTQSARPIQCSARSAECNSAGRTDYKSVFRRTGIICTRDNDL